MSTYTGQTASGQSRVHNGDAYYYDTTARRRMRTKPSNPAEQKAIDEKFWKAAKDGQLIRVQRLIEQGADVDCTFKGSGQWYRSYPVSAMYAAAAGGFTEVVKELIDEGADLNQLIKEKNDRIGETAMWIAASHGHAGVVAALCEAGADVNICALHNKSALYQATRSQHTTTVKVLIEANANIDHVSRDGETALYKAAQLGYAEIVNMLITAGANVNSHFPCHHDKEKNPLIAASTRGDFDVVKLLLAAGADVDCRIPTGSTALHIASAKTNIDDGVDILMPTSAVAVSWPRTGIIFPEPLLLPSGFACTGFPRLEEDITRILDALIIAGANVNATNSVSRTALHYVEQYGSGGPSLVERLIVAGADINARDMYAYTPLDLAHRRWSENPVVEVLKKHGAKFGWELPPMLYSMRCVVQ